MTYFAVLGLVGQLGAQGFLKARTPRAPVSFRGRFPWERVRPYVCFSAQVPLSAPTVPEGHKHRVTTPENPRKISRTPAEPRRAPQNPRRDPRRTLGETPQSPLRGKFPRRASRRVVPLGMVTLRNFRISPPPRPKKHARPGFIEWDECTPRLGIEFLGPTRYIVAGAGVGLGHATSIHETRKQEEVERFAQKSVSPVAVVVQEKWR